MTGCFRSTVSGRSCPWSRAQSFIMETVGSTNTVPTQHCMADVLYHYTRTTPALVGFVSHRLATFILH